MNVVVIIPTIDPDERIVSLVCQLQKRGLSRFVIVNDGSAPKCDELFAELERLGACVLHHAINLGKGAAIKTGLAAVRKLFPTYPTTSSASAGLRTAITTTLLSAYATLTAAMCRREVALATRLARRTSSSTRA